MRRVFLIGKFNEVFEEVNHYLSDYFNVQVCVDNLDLIKGMLKLNRPDIIVVNLTDFTGQQVEILEELKKEYADVPVVCTGAAAEPAEFVSIFRDAHFHVLDVFATHEQILESIYEVLHIDYDVDGGVFRKVMSKRKNVLLIDDSPLQLRTMNEMLKGKYDVQMATAGVIEEAKDVPVIFLTGVKDRAHIQAVLELHPAGYLLKPASARMIHATLQKYLY